METTECDSSCNFSRARNDSFCSKYLMQSKNLLSAAVVNSINGDLVLLYSFSVYPEGIRPVEVVAPHEFRHALMTEYN